MVIEAERTTRLPGIRSQGNGLEGRGLVVPPLPAVLDPTDPRHRRGVDEGQGQVVRVLRSEDLGRRIKDVRRQPLIDLARLAMHPFDRAAGQHVVELVEQQLLPRPIQQGRGPLPTTSPNRLCRKVFEVVQLVLQPPVPGLDRALGGQRALVLLEVELTSPVGKNIGVCREPAEELSRRPSNESRHAEQVRRTLGDLEVDLTRPTTPVPCTEEDHPDRRDAGLGILISRGADRQTGP